MNVAFIPLNTAGGDWWPYGRQAPPVRARGGQGFCEWLQSLWFAVQQTAGMTTAGSVTGPLATVIKEDQRAIQLTLGGDRSAFSQLVERYQDQVGRWMWKFTRDSCEWEALVQDVFVEAYLSLDRYRGAGAFAGWLRTISTRVGYRFWKRRQRRAIEQPWSLAQWDQVARADDADAVSPEDAARQVHELLAQLGPRDRLVLTLHYLEDCSVAEIAAQTGWTQTMVKVQMHRARNRLRKLTRPSLET